MNRTQLGILIVSVVMAIGAPSVASGQVPKGINNRLVTISRPASQAERDQIREFVRYEAARLNSDDLATCEEARERLVRPLRSPGVTLHFRVAYEDPIIDELHPVVRQTERPMAAFNALQIVSLLATQKALDVMREHCDVDRESRESVRLRAAIGIQNIIREAGANVIPPRDEKQAIRDLGRAAKSEPVGWVLFRQLDALANIDNPLAQETIDDAFDAIVGRLATGDATELVVALRPALVHMRDRHIANPAVDQARDTAPLVVKFLDLPLKNWADIQSDESLRKQVHEVIDIGEKLLRLIDQAVAGDARRLGDPQLAQTFIQRDRDGYGRSLSHVKDVVADYR